MELGHLLTRSGLTYPEVSSKVYHDSFCQLGSSVSLPWVIYFEAFYLHVALFTGGEGGWYVGLANLSPLCGDCPQIWAPQHPGTLKACPGLYRDCTTFHQYLLLLTFRNPK